jgi:hypothetical protein
MGRMKGRIGGSMTTIRIGPKPLPASAYESAPVMCPVCYSVPKQPCRRVQKSTKPGVLKLGGPMPTMHPARRQAAGLPPVPGQMKAGEPGQAGKRRRKRRPRPDQPGGS